MNDNIEGFINSEIRIRRNFINIIRKAYELPPGDCYSYSVDQLNNLAGANSTIMKINNNSLIKETKHDRLVCFLKAGFLWHKLDNFMSNQKLKRLDYNPENLPDLDFLTQLIEYFDKKNSMGLLKPKVI